MTVVLYCQHVLGLGHYARSLAVARALAPHRVVFVTGGPAVELPLPGHVVPERLPVLAMDEEFTELHAETAPGGDLTALKAERAARLMAVLDRERPAVFLVELYPFGRRAFEFELLPALEALWAGRFGPTRAVCSLRDILVEKKDPRKYQTRVIGRLNSLFDALLVHSDPAMFPLSETFPRAAEIAVPVVHTGFVTEHPDLRAAEALRRRLGLAPGEKLVVASAGGGKVGSELLFAAVEAAALLRLSRRVRLAVFTGPFLDDGAFERLVAMTGCGSETTVSRFATDFPDWLAAADASVSLAGYNTTMNILAARVPALVWPFAQNREQATRAGRLARPGMLEVLEAADLDPTVLAGRLDGLLRRGGRVPEGRIGLDGAAFTARWLADWPIGQST